MFLKVFYECHKYTTFHLTFEAIQITLFVTLFLNDCTSKIFQHKGLKGQGKRVVTTELNDATLNVFGSLDLD